MKSMNIELHTRFLFFESKKFLFIAITFLLCVVGLYSYLYLKKGGWEYLIQVIVFSVWVFEFVLNYKGRSMNQVFGKAYLRLNEEGVRYKSREWKKEESMTWKEMNYIRFTPLSLTFQSQSEQELELKLGTLSYKDILDIKEQVRIKAKECGIKIGR